jgi:intein/homing endonuclease
MKIKDINHPVYVYSMDSNGKLVIKKASASWVSKKNAELLEISISNGQKIKVTPNHKIYIKNKGWIESKDLNVGDKPIALLRSRRGASYSGVRLSSQCR